MKPGRIFSSVRLLVAYSLGWAALFTPVQPASAGDAYKWSVQYLIDNSRTIFGRPQKVSPRSNRGLAISPDGKFLYAGYIHSFNGSGEVRRISLTSNDYDRATVAILPGPLAKAIMTDDKGRVYISDGNAILIYDAELKEKQIEVETEKCEGLVVTREGGDLILYGTERELSLVHRWRLHEKGGIVTDAEPNGFSGSGELKMPAAVDLRGMNVDSKGRLWIADLKGNKVYRISRDGKDLGSSVVTTPLNIAFDHGRVFITRSTDRAITVMDEEMNLLGTLAVPWEELELAPFGNNRHGSLTGIAIIPGKGFFVANEGGQTANQRSTYGRVDGHTDVINGKLYKDAFEDDNEPILRATEVTTAP